MSFIEIKADGSLGVEVNGVNPPFRLSDGRRIRGKVTLDNCYQCPTDDEGNRFAELWPVVMVTPVPSQPHQFATSSFQDSKDDVMREVDRTTVWDGHIDVETAYSRVKADLDRRWFDALDRGIPYSVALNGDTLHALLRYNEVDRLVWGTWDYSMPSPAGGLLVALKQPINAPGKPYDGKDEFSISGVPRLQGAKVAIGDHVNGASKAWEKGKDELLAIKNGAGTEQAKVEALAAYDVNKAALGWPSNDLPT